MIDVKTPKITKISNVVESQNTACLITIEAGETVAFVEGNASHTAA